MTHPERLQIRVQLMEVLPFQGGSEIFINSLRILERYVLNESPSQAIVELRIRLLRKVYMANHSPMEAVKWAGEIEAFACEPEPPKAVEPPVVRKSTKGRQL